MAEFRLPRYAFVVLYITAGCTSSPPAAPPLPERISPAPNTETTPPAVGVAGKTWRFTPSRQPHKYTSITNAVIEGRSSGSSSSSSRDSVIQNIQYSIAISGESATREFSGTVDAFSIVSGGRLSDEMSPGAALPVSFSGHIESGSITLDELTGQSRKSSLNCANPAALVWSVLQRNIQAIPAELVSDRTWTDSSTTNICTGLIPTTITTIRTYRVLGEADYTDQKVIVVERSDKTRSSGEGSQDQHRLIFISEGIGMTRLYLNQLSGVVVGTEGEQRSTVVVTTSGRSQQFTQLIKEKTFFNPLTP